MSRHTVSRSGRNANQPTELRRGAAPATINRGSGRDGIVRGGLGSAGASCVASRHTAPVAPAPSSQASLLDNPGGTVEINDGQFNATAGHHISVTINTGSPEGAHTNTLGSNRRPDSNGDFEEDIDRDEPTRRRPPTPPAQRSCDIYYRHMATLRRGSPLWIPEPNKSLAIQYQRKGMAIGDVGIITSFGSFDFLFNICLAHDHPIQPEELPESFEPFFFANSDVHRMTEFKRDSYLASASIERSQYDGDLSGLVFESSASEGAILTMPVGSNSEDLVNVIRLRKYIAANAASWYKYVYDVRGREVLNGDVRLVTGYDKTKAWGMATFANSTAQKDSFRLKFKPMEQNIVGRTYGWESSGVAQVRAGPDRQEVEALREDDPLQEGMEYENQCLFVRTMNATLPDKVWKEIALKSNILVDLDTYTSSSFESSSVPGVSGTGTSRNALNITSANHAGAGSSSRTTVNNVGIYSGQSIHAFEAALPLHPPKAINEMLLKSAKPHVRMVITEDRDWTSILTNNDIVLPSPVDLCARINATSIMRVCEEEGIVFLQSNESQDTSDTNIMPPASLHVDHCRDLDTNDEFGDDDDDNLSLDGIYEISAEPAPYYPGITVCIVCELRPPYSKGGKSYPTCGLACAVILEDARNSASNAASTSGAGSHAGSSYFRNRSYRGRGAASSSNSSNSYHIPSVSTEPNISHLSQHLGGYTARGGNNSHRPPNLANVYNFATYGPPASPASPASPAPPMVKCVVCLVKPRRDSKYVTCGLTCTEKLCKGGANPNNCDYCHQRPKIPGNNQCSNTCRDSAKLACLLCKSRPKYKQYHLCGKTCKQIATKEIATKSTPLILEAPPGHVTYEMVEKKFQSAWNHLGHPCPKIKKIYKIIESKTFLQPYDQYKRSVGNEVFRYHGTMRKCTLGSPGNTQLCTHNSCPLCSILRTSFKASLANPSGAFGPGVYTTSASNKAYGYTGGGNGAMLLTKVVLGKVRQVNGWNEVMSCPPGFNSVVFDRQNGALNETIVYTDDAVRPVFLIIF